MSLLEEREKSSFRDPDSQVWTGAGRLFRDLMPSYREDYKMLNDSGLYAELIDRGLLIPHLETYVGDDRIVIEPQVVPFISYPYEWCFSQLQKAALVTLEINLAALQRGMILKDATAFNIQFIDGTWKLIDTASFEKYEEGKPWMAYGQFMRHFVMPLVMCKYRGSGCLKLGQIHLDGLPIEMARDLPLRSWLSPRCVLYVHSTRAARGGNNWYLNKKYLVNLLQRLMNYVKSLDCKHKEGWDQYSPEDSYTKAKEQAVKNAMGVSQGTVCDIGANTGKYSRMAAEMGKEVVAIDRDHDCIERMAQERHILPLVVDLTNPTPAVGWGNEERRSFLERARFDTVLSLALIHHLCIGSNIPLSSVAGQLRWVTKETLIIEFVPEDDEKAQLLGRGRVYPAYSQEIFEAEFGKRFVLRGRKDIGDSCRKLYIYSVR